VGAGRGAEAFAHFAAALGWQVTLLDHRPGLLASLTLPPGTRSCRTSSTWTSPGSRTR
jgi:hypothetical protein